MATPVTIPEEPMVILLLLTLQVPPIATSVNEMDKPTHTLPGPVMVPAFGNGLTVIVVVAEAVPQPLVTV